MTLLQLRGNALGFAMIVASALVAAVGGLVLKLADPLVMMGVGVALVLMDLLIRLRARPTADWLTKRELGGYLYFLPIWCNGQRLITTTEHTKDPKFPLFSP